ncbi:MAG: Fis family transcriptional regulator [Xanthomonadales bacterium]|nr:Fis family transcriptional regulator [Xanthomonadales bacterium]
MTSVPSKKQQSTPLRDHVRKTIRQYLDDMDSTEPEHVYQKLLAEIEPPLIEEVLRFTGGNQSRAARILGITRNTLRSKLRRYAIKPR